MSIVFQISDCHLSDETSYYNFERALGEVSKDTAHAAVLLTGDLVCGPKPGDYTKLSRIIDKYIKDKPIYAIAGNHDDLVLMKEELRNSSIKVVKHCRIAGREIVFLDSSQKPINSVHPLGSGRLDRLDLSLLKKVARKRKKPIVVIHHPVIRVGSDWMKAICLENDDYTFSILKRFGVKDVICGHGHDHIVTTKEEVTQHMAPSTAYGFDHKISEYNRSALIGINKLTLFNGQVTSEMIRL